MANNIENNNTEIIEKLAYIYEEMNNCIEKVQSVLDDTSMDREVLVDAYKGINEKRKEALQLISQYQPTDDPVETNNMKTLRKGFLNIINTAKASMLVENSYDNQRGINKMSLDTLIPVFSFKLHHAPNMQEEIFMISCFSDFEDLYKEQSELASVQIDKSKEARESLSSDLENVNLLLDDYEVVNHIYQEMIKNRLITNNYENIVIQVEQNKNRVVSQIYSPNEDIRTYIATYSNIEKLGKTSLKFVEKELKNLVVEEDNIIKLKELKEIDGSIKDALKDLDTSLDTLSKKMEQLEEDKKALDVVRDDFMKNGTEHQSNEGGGLRLSAE